MAYRVPLDVPYVPPNLPTLGTSWDPAACGQTLTTNNGYFLITGPGVAFASRGHAKFTAVPAGAEHIAGIVLGVGQRVAFCLGGIAVSNGVEVEVIGIAAPDPNSPLGYARFNYGTGVRTTIAALVGPQQAQKYTGGFLHVGVRKVAGVWYHTWSFDGYTWMDSLSALVVPTEYGIGLNCDGEGPYVHVGHLYAATDAVDSAANIPSWARFS